jgi:1-acyl-sn-glycerol-3-phosphate acyltransferase
MWALMVLSVTAAVFWLRWRLSGQYWLHWLGLGLVRFYAQMLHGIPSRCRAPIPPKGAALLIANHTCSSDPAFLQCGVCRPLGFVVAREYYDDLPWARPLFDYIGCVPVCRNGRDVAGLRIALRRLSEGRAVCIFPEGGLRDAGGSRLRRSRAGAALLALRSRAPVYPAFIHGGPQHDNVLRAWLLPSRTRVVYGPPVDLSAYYERTINRPLLEEVMNLLMRHVAALEPKKR